MRDALTIPELERLMRPGTLSRRGFLGPAESLEAVIARDRETLKALGVSYDQIADALERVLQAAIDQEDQARDRILQDIARGGIPASASADARARRRPIIPVLHRPHTIPHYSLEDLPDTDLGELVDGKLQVFRAVFRGLQECPWGCDLERWSCFDFLVLNRQSGAYVTGPGLIVHLIREHHFFEGLDTPYRTDPEKLVRVLELA